MLEIAILWLSGLALYLLHRVTVEHRGGTRTGWFGLYVLTLLPWVVIIFMSPILKRDNDLKWVWWPKLAMMATPLCLEFGATMIMSVIGLTLIIEVLSHG